MARHEWDPSKFSPYGSSSDDDYRAGILRLVVDPMTGEARYEPKRRTWYSPKITEKGSGDR